MKTVIFSFDDGRLDQYEYAYSILKEYGFPATINVVSEFVSNPKRFNAFKTFDNKSLTWENLKKMYSDGNWEIACHGANHKNTIEDIAAWKKDTNIINNDWNCDVGFASPGSYICEENKREIEKLIDNKELLYIRSGKRIRREGLSYIFLTLLNRLFRNPVIFFRLNKDCIIKNESKFMLSIGITKYDSPAELIYFLNNMPNGTAVIFMFHSIAPKSLCKAAKDVWYWKAEDLNTLCKYVSEHDADYRVITTKSWVIERGNRYV